MKNIFGKSSVLIRSPLETVFEVVSRPETFLEYNAYRTMFDVEDIEEVNGKQIYSGVTTMRPYDYDEELFIEMRPDADNALIEWFFGKKKDDLNHYEVMRFFDGKKSLDEEGTIVLWNNFADPSTVPSAIAAVGETLNQLKLFGLKKYIEDEIERIFSEDNFLRDAEISKDMFVPPVVNTFKARLSTAHDYVGDVRTLEGWCDSCLDVTRVEDIKEDEIFMTTWAMLEPTDLYMKSESSGNENLGLVNWYFGREYGDFHSYYPTMLISGERCFIGEENVLFIMDSFKNRSSGSAYLYEYFNPLHTFQVGRMKKIIENI